jgi:hypothetical protein
MPEYEVWRMANEVEEPFEKVSQWEEIMRSLDAAGKARGGDTSATEPGEAARHVTAKDTRTSEMTRQDAPENDVDYVYVIHNVFPDLSPKVAFRRTGVAAQNTRKIIKCPHCNGRLTDVDVSTRVELFRRSEKRNVTCQIYRKCAHCHKEVGINIV